MRKINKKGFDMPFSWIFAIIAGTVILFLALYAVSKFIDVAKEERGAEVAKSLTILVDPIETGIASAVGSSITFDEETQTFFGCDNPTSFHVFGRQTIAVSEKSGLKQEFAKPGPEISVYNKFIFAREIEQGKKLYLFSKPFYFGYKVTDLIMASSKKYCFIGSPNIIEDELSLLSLANINLTGNMDFCQEDSIKVCFGMYDVDCDISVESNEDYETGKVTKNMTTLYYAGSLIYAAIFSDPYVYECNIKRLAAKASALAEVYKSKAELVKVKDCNTIIEPYLETISIEASKIKNSQEFVNLYSIAKQMDRENEKADCKIYPGEDY